MTADQFEALRPLLTRHAYRMLGSWSDAEDIVQDAYVRWHGDGNERADVREPRAFLRTTVTHLALDRLRSARAQREVYVGPWLPEPVLDANATSPEAEVELADDISFALLLALERLSPLERAAFLLHDVLEVPFGEIAESLQRSEDAVRQLASRARDHVRESKRRRIASGDARRILDQLQQAIRNDDVAAVMNLLTTDAVLLSDGGGKRRAAINPLIGADRIARFLIGVSHKPEAQRIKTSMPARINGLPGVVLGYEDGSIDQTFAVEIDGGRICAIYLVRNPDKLHAVEAALDEGHPASE
jgi:RNA polymerase sigma-70 factor (ECF subfamily)